MSERVTPWFPSENGASCPDGSHSSDVIAVLADAEFLLLALAEEIERSRDFRASHVRLRKSTSPDLTQNYANGTR